MKSLQEFLGMVNFYHRFLPQAAQLMQPLYEALKGKVARHAVIWTDERNKAFDDAKAALANSTMLAHPAPNVPISITSDASDYAVGAVHEQWVSGAWQPLAFFSRQLRPNERIYSTFDRKVVPTGWRQQIFDAVHGLSHPGKRPSQKLVAAKFVWHGLKKDVRKWAETCVV